MTAEGNKFTSFYQVFQNAKTISGAKPLMVDAARTLTYEKLLDCTARLGAMFEKHNIKPGARMVIATRDAIAHTVLFLGCLRHGVTAIPLNPEAREDEFTSLLGAITPDLVAADTNILPHMNTKALQLEIDCGADAYAGKSLLSKMLGKKQAGDIQFFPHLLEKFEAVDEVERELPAETLAYILFTSGTTSKPKGVQISHGNLIAQMRTFIKQYQYDSKVNLLNILPLHHTDGLTQGPVVAFCAGGTVHRPLKFQVSAIGKLLNSIYKNKITHFIAVPSMLQLIEGLSSEYKNAFQTPDFKFVISTAGYLDAGLWERFEDGFQTKIVNVYGLTETVCEALYCGPDAETWRRGTIGKPVDCEAKIVDEAGKEVGPDQMGELWLRGAHIMAGYLDMAEETAAVLDAEGWFKTGDLCTKSHDGFYTVVGRKKNVIITGGINIYPDDVAGILASLPGVSEAAVYGEPDDIWGEIAIAALVTKDGQEIDTADISAAFLQKASSEKLPRRFYCVESLPRGPAGKVVIEDLKKNIQALENKNASDTEAADEASDVKIISVAAKSFKCSPEALSMQSSTNNTKGWNSLAHVEFLLNLEKTFQILLEPKDILSVKSLSDAQNLVRSKRAA